MENEIKVCCICGSKFSGWGNNPDGAAWKDELSGEVVIGEFNSDDRCCDECNSRYVIPGRLYLMNKRNNKK